MGPRQYDTALGPLIAVAALVVLLLVCRWVFSTTGRDQRAAQRLTKALSAGDYGLLVPVATVRTVADAELLRDVLGEGGIRATISSGPAGPADQVVLVFRHDEQRARQLVS